MVSISGLFNPNQGKSQAGQAQILAAALFLLLVPATVIVAQNATNNSSLNVTGDLLANLTPANTTLFANATYENATPAGPSTVNKTGSASRFVINASLSSATSLTENYAAYNSSLNATGDQLANATSNGKLGNSTPEPPANSTENSTEPSCTSNLTNTTYPAMADEESSTKPPELSLSISLPERADRGNSFTAIVTVANRGDAPAEAVLDWSIPDGLIILAGSLRERIILEGGASLERNIELEAPLSFRTGAHEIRAMVRYHD